MDGKNMNIHALTKTTVNRLMASLFLLICMAFIIYEVRQKPRIFVLHSYHESYSWSQEVTEGIERVLNNKPYSIRWHYMDTKRHPDTDFKARAAEATLSTSGNRTWLLPSPTTRNRR